jgi:enoyl-CoA hydratase
MLDCDVPIVAQISGACMGAGHGDRQLLRHAHCRRVRPLWRADCEAGFPMAPREAQLVAQAVGALTAREMLLEAAVLDAPLMLARGFLSRVVPTPMWPPGAGQRAAHRGAGAPGAARMPTSRPFVDFEPPPAPAGNARAATDLIAGAYRYADSAEHREGVPPSSKNENPCFDTMTES